MIRFITQGKKKGNKKAITRVWETKISNSNWKCEFLKDHLTNWKILDKCQLQREYKGKFRSFLRKKRLKVKKKIMRKKDIWRDTHMTRNWGKLQIENLKQRKERPLWRNSFQNISHEKVGFYVKKKKGLKEKKVQPVSLQIKLLS